jgi:two-component system invasion response regulator UvrY
MPSDKINILLVCEFQIVCLGIVKLIENHKDLSVFGRAPSLADLTAILKKSHIDVALVELSLLKQPGLSAIRDILKTDPGLKIIVLSRDEKEPFISNSIDNGALGFISLKCPPEEMIEAIRCVYENEKYLSKDVAYEFAISSLCKEKQTLSGLTSREFQVFTMLCHGKSVTEIAETIYLSPKTVHVYRASIMNKLSVKNLADLTLIALKNGIVSIDSVK